MKTFVTKDSEGNEGPTINVENIQEANSIIEDLNINQENKKYHIYGEQVIIGLQ